jgi:polysaccharide biosynthesis/export protein
LLAPRSPAKANAAGVILVGLAVLFSMLQALSGSRSLRTSASARRLNKIVALAMLPVLVSSCSTSVGPSRQSVEKAPAETSLQGMRVVDVTTGVAQQVAVNDVQGNFAESLGDAAPIGTVVGVGDALEVTIWEAAPAALFGAATIGTQVGSELETSRANTLPALEVGPSGMITIPFAGQIRAAGRSLRQIEQEIVARLRGKAHEPQAIVRIARNATLNVTVLGDVKSPQRVPLTPRGERLLDVIAQAGGTSEPLERMTIQITRGGVVQRMAARDLVSDPRQNIILQSDDVVTAFFQPYSFTVLGAAGKNDEIRFEGAGITLSQALGRIGGLLDERADPRGVFLFRWERPELLGPMSAGLQPNADGLVPVIYRADMKSPDTFFAAQRFSMRDGDVVYVSNSQLSDLRRFIGILATSMLPVGTARNIVR